MASNLEPSTSKVVKRRVELLSSQALKKACSSNNEAVSSSSGIKTIDEFLNLPLFSAEEIDVINDPIELNNVVSLNFSLHTLFRAFHEKCSDNSFKLSIFDQIVLWLKAIKVHNRKSLTQANDVRHCIENAKAMMEDQSSDANIKEQLRELIRELRRFRVVSNQSKVMEASKNAERSKELESKIKQLTDTIEDLRDADYGLDDLGSSTSPYARLVKLEHKLLSYWKEYENINGRCSKLTGDENFYYKFNYQNDNLPAKVNQAVSTFFQNYIKETKNFEKKISKLGDKIEVPILDIVMLNKHLKEEIRKSAPTFKLHTDLLDKIYSDLIGEQKKRRLFQFADQQFYYNFYGSPEAMPDEASRELNKELQSNAEKRKKDMNKLMEEFNNKQFKQIGEKVKFDEFDDDHLFQLDDEDNLNQLDDDEEEGADQQEEDDDDEIEWLD